VIPARRLPAGRIERRAAHALETSAALGALAFVLSLEGVGGVIGTSVIFAFIATSIARRRWLALGSLGENVIALVSSISIPAALAAGLDVQVALAAFLVFAQFAKTLGPRSDRDEKIMLVVSAIHVAVAAATGGNFSLAPIFLVYLGAVAWALSLREIRACARERARAGDPDALEVRTGAGLLARSVTLALAGVLLSGLLFPFVPRVSARIAPRPRHALQRVSGFSDVIDLSEIGRIRPSDEIAFRAVVIRRGALPARPFWRGRALDAYNGQTWILSPPGRNAVVQQVDGTGDRGLEFDLLDRRSRRIWEPRTEPTEVELVVEPTRTWTLFALPNTTRLVFRNRNQGLVGRNVYGNLSTFEPRTQGAAYRVIAHPSEPEPLWTWATLDLGDPRRSGRTSDFRAECLVLPPIVDVARIGAHARSVLASARVADDAPPSRKVRALEAHLQDPRNYRYTLDAARTPGAEPVSDFLFTNREGHCELFASALAVMLRTIHVPSRVVTGYRGGEYRLWSDAYTVTQRNAHAWVEALVEDGWRPFDPTPSDDLQSSRLGVVLTTLEEAKDWLEIRWIRSVVTYDSSDRASILREITDRIALLRDSFTDVDASVALSPSVAIGLGAAILAVAIVVGLGGPREAARALARQLARASARAPEPAARASDALTEVIDALSRRGVVRLPAWTALDLADEAAAKLGPVAVPLRGLVERYYAARFGGAEFGDADRAAFVGLAREIVAARG
jgi:transglutaminase-like putative cysteine protease